MTSLVAELRVELGIGHDDLLRLIETAPKRYKRYYIPKRSGGMREIAHPARELKEIQRYILAEKLPLFPIHDIATAYVKGRGILDNAKKHVGAYALLKLDFTNFFPSIVPSDFTRIVRKLNNPKVSIADIGDYHKLMFWGRGAKQPSSLSIGAPTSPAVSNIVLYEFDQALAEAAYHVGATVTRYADDITASADKVERLIALEARIDRILVNMRSPKITLNNQKRGIYTRGQKQLVTGLLLTPDGRVSIGRERKRIISSLIHKSLNGTATEEEFLRVRGLLGFCYAAEASFINSMRMKYGDENITAILAKKLPYVFDDDLLDLD